MDNSTLITIYNSYVERIHSLNKGQYSVTIILTGLYVLVIKAFIDLKMTEKLQEIGVGMYWLTTVASLVLIFIYLSYSYRMLIFSRLLSRIEARLALPKDVCFYSVHTLGRRISYIISQSIPFVLYISLVLFLKDITEIPSIWYGIGLHLVILILFIILFLVTGENKSISAQK